jgi:acetolactate synthase-1/2/3 large subunit
MAHAGDSDPQLRLLAFAEEILPALEAAMKVTDRPCLIEFLVAREANVLPMIPAGGSTDDMILELD